MEEDWSMEVEAEFENGEKEAQKRSQKIQSIQYKRRKLATRKCCRTRRDSEAQRGCQAGRGACPFSVGQSRENGRTEAEMEAELQSLQAGEERRASNASQGVGCCIVWKEWRSSWAFWERKKAMYHSDYLRGMLHRMVDAQTPPEQVPGKEEEEEQRNRAFGRGGDEEAFQRLLVLILFGFQMQGVKAEHQEASAHPFFEKRWLFESPAGNRKPMEDDSNLLSWDPPLKKTARERTREVASSAKAKGREVEEIEEKEEGELKKKEMVDKVQRGS